MTNVTMDEYFYIRKELRQKYFTNNKFTQLIDIPDFQGYLKPNNPTHIGEIAEAHFLAHYLIQPNQRQTLNETKTYDGLDELNMILSNPNQYLRRDEWLSEWQTVMNDTDITQVDISNIQAVYDYLEELNRYHTEQWLNNRLNKTLNLFEKYKTDLLITSKPNNNQQLWL